MRLSEFPNQNETVASFGFPSWTMQASLFSVARAVWKQAARLKIKTNENRGISERVLVINVS
jgi:cob(I)alamin adenosyltransferase